MTSHNAPSIKRLLPEVPFPPYSYVSGVYPHPTTDPAGHSYGKQAAEVIPQPRSEQWQSLKPYLLGIDLFNAGFYWEAHEVWEPLWIAAGRTTTTARFFQGLIKLAAACVKYREGNAAGTARHTQRAGELFDLAWQNHPSENNPSSRDSPGGAKHPQPVRLFGLAHQELVEMIDEINKAARVDIRPNAQARLPCHLWPQDKS